MTDPAISIVISIYNDARFIEESINSLLQQTERNFEIVAVNDGSTDSSAEILQQLCRKDNRIRVLTQENQGLTRALINGCNASRGEFIARQDGDDWSHPQRLLKQLEILRDNPEVAFVGCWAEGVTKEGTPLERVERPQDADQATRALRFERQGPPAHGTIMFRRSVYEAVGGYRPEFYFSQDSDLWLRMAEVGRIYYVPEVLYYYRRDAESLSSVRHNIQFEFGEIGQACHSLRLQGGDEAELLQQAARLTEQIRAGQTDSAGDNARIAATQYLIGSQLAMNGDRSAVSYLLPVIRRQPWHLKAWIRLVQAGIALPRSS